MSNTTRSIFINNMFALLFVISFGAAVGTSFPDPSLVQARPAWPQLLGLPQVDPECYMTTPELILDNGHTPETHFVTTEDGYILQIFRIKPAKGLSGF